MRRTFKFVRDIFDKLTMSTSIVKITDGILQGSTCKTLNNVHYYAFKSIPYAKPPVGELRFAVPQPPEPWTDVRDATKNCSICVQFDRATNTIIGDEDCLYLNVYTPQLPEKGSSLPVMVFFHGGGFVFGNGTDDTVHGPDFLVEKDVVLVSLNYRLGILGFLGLDDKDAPGNMGLRDQVQALKWVKNNIVKFGGDPNNVTIFGISAGGASVEYLMLSPLSKGLFHKAIAQSGSSLLRWAQNDNVKELCFKIPLLNKVSITSNEDLLKYLKKMPIKDLIVSSMQVLAADTFSGGINFGYVPTVENPKDWEPFLSENTYTKLSKGKFHKVPFMAGFCSQEGLLMPGINGERFRKLTESKDFLQYFPFTIDETNKQQMSNKLKSIYLEGKSTVSDPDGFAIDFFGDVDFIGGIYVATKLIAKNNSSVYFYEFAYDGGLNYLKKKLGIKRQGTCHGDDGGYVIKSNILSGEISEKDALVRERLTTMWTNFAKFGDPTPSKNNLIPTKWEPTVETDLAFMYIDDNLTMRNSLYPDRMKLFEEMYEKNQGCK